MSFTNYAIAELWGTFMTRRNEIKDTVSNDLISLVVYNPNHFINFNPSNRFDRWATVEVSSFDNVPEDMETFILNEGKYAVFDHKGDAETFKKTFQYILEEWLPNSDFELDDRPHFEVLGEKYKNDDPTSEEQIWVPIKSKFNQ